MAGTLKETITGSVTGVPGGALSITLTSTVTLSASRNSSHGYIDATSDSYKSELECVSPSITYNNGIVGSSKSLTKPSVTFSGTFPTTAGTYVKVIQVGLGDTTSVISKSYIEFRLTITVESLITIKCSATNGSVSLSSVSVPKGSVVSKSTAANGIHTVSFTSNSISYGTVTFTPNAGYEFSSAAVGSNFSPQNGGQFLGDSTYTVTFTKMANRTISFNSANATPSATSISVPYGATYTITDGETPSITFSDTNYQNTVSFTPDTGYTFLKSNGIGYVDPNSSTGALIYTSSGTVTADMEFGATPNAMHKIGLDFTGVSCSECSEGYTYVPDGSKYNVDNATKTITFTYDGTVFSKYTYTIDSGYVFHRVGIVTVNGDVDYEYDGTYSGNADDIDDILIEAVKYCTITINTVGCTVDKPTLSVEEYTDFTVSGNTAEFSYDSEYTTVTVTPLAGYENPVWSPSKIIDIRSDQTITVECSKINYKATVYLSQSDGIEQYAKVTVTRNGTSTDYTENSEITFNVDDKISAVWYANTVESTTDYEKTYTTYNRCAEIALTGGDSEGGVISYGSTVTMPAFTGSYSASIRPYSSAIVTSVKKYYRAYISFKADGGSGTLPGVYDYGYSSGAGYTKWFDDESKISTSPSPDTWLVAENTPWTKDLLEKENYHLIGWYLDSDDDVIPLDSDTIYISSKGAHTLTAVWEGDPVEHFFTSYIDNALVVGVSPVHSLIIETGYTYQSQKKTEKHLSVPGSLTADYGTIVSFKADATSEGGNYYPVYKKVTVSRIKGVLGSGGESKTYDTPLYESDSYNTLSFTVDKEFTQIELSVTAYTFKIVYNAGDRDISYTDTATYYQGMYTTLPTLESIYSASQDTAFYSNDVRTFKGWALSQADVNSKTVTYEDGQSKVYFSTYTSENTPSDDDTLTLYAVWEYHTAIIYVAPKPSDKCSKVIDISGDTLIDAKLPSSVIWPLVIRQYSPSRGSPSIITKNIINSGKTEIQVVSDAPSVDITPAGESDYYVNYKKYKTVEFFGHESSISTKIYFSTADKDGNHTATVSYIPKTAKDDCTLSFEAFGYTLILHRNKESSDNGNKEDTATLSIQYWQALETVLPPYNNIADIDSDWSYGDRKFLGWATSKDSIVPDSEYMDGATVCYSKLDDDAAATPSDSDELNLYAVWSAEVLICIAPNPDDSSENYWVQTSAGSMQIEYIFEKGATPRNSDGSINTDKRRALEEDEVLETPVLSDLSVRFEGWKCASWGSDILKSTSELMAYKFAGNKLTEYYVYASFTDKVYYPISFVDKDGYAYHFRDNIDQSFNLETTRTVDKVNSVTGALIEQDVSFTPDPENRKWQSDQSNATITSSKVDVPRTGVTYYEDDYPSDTPDEVTLAVRRPGEFVIHLGTIQSVSNSYSASLTTIPVLPYGYSGTFCMDLGVQRSISVSTVRVTPANSSDTSPDSRDWSNRKWLKTLKNLSDRWQMTTNGVSLWMYVPAEMAHNMPNLTIDKDEDNIKKVTGKGTWSRVNAYISSLPISYSAGDMHRLALTLTFRVGTIYPKPPTVEYSQISLVKDGVTKRIISAPMNSSYVVPGCDSAILPISEGLFEGWVYKFDGKLYQPGDILKTYYYNTDGIKTPIDDEDSELSVKYTSLSKGGYVYYYDSEEFSNGVGTVTIPTGKTKVTICAVGGGGAGGAGTDIDDYSHTYYFQAAGGGGGSGYYMVRRINLSDLGDDVATLYINIGQGGQNAGKNGHATFVRATGSNGRVLAIAYGGEGGGTSKTGGSGGKGYMSGGNGGYAKSIITYSTTEPPKVTVKYISAYAGDASDNRGGDAGEGTYTYASASGVYFYHGGGGGGGEPPKFGSVNSYGGNGSNGTDVESNDGKYGGGGGGAATKGALDAGKGGDGYVYLIWE